MTARARKIATAAVAATTSFVVVTMIIAIGAALFLLPSTAAQEGNDPLITADELGNLHINATTAPPTALPADANGNNATHTAHTGTILLNGANVLQKMDSLKQIMSAQQSAAATFESNLAASGQHLAQLSLQQNAILSKLTAITACRNISFSPEIAISTSADGAQGTVAADVDGDGILDVLGASRFDNTIAWWRNTDSRGTFSERIVITTNATGAIAADAADLDGDGDIDVLSASYHSDTLAWYENLNGNGAFSEPKPITNTADGAVTILAADMDGDGDLDVLGGSYIGGKVAWYENVDGNGNFSQENIISTDADGLRKVVAADLDGDGDLDVLIASYLQSSIAWYENLNGLGEFSPRKNISSVSGARSVFASDLDKDGDLDVLSASMDDNEVAWFENLDGSGTFSTPKIIAANARGAQYVLAVDLDRDGDMDVVSASWFDDKIAWYENLNGSGTFSQENVITTQADGATTVAAADIDGDGFVDILSASREDDTLAWYKNKCKD